MLNEFFYNFLILFSSLYIYKQVASLFEFLHKFFVFYIKKRKYGTYGTNENLPKLITTHSDKRFLSNKSNFCS